MGDESFGAAVAVRRRAPAVVLLLALCALVLSVCHGSHGHLLPGTGTPSVAAPASPHGCEQPGERAGFDAHLPSQTAPQPPLPDAPGTAPCERPGALFGEARRTGPYDRDGPAAPAARARLIALGVDRN
ncbi:hypothetical protein ABT160_19400 [Streptomyces sp. NPDC001941]|uniref:hypothetical protein n=1 Tax=Streptomyces sp. NPDC001941 TaxID=3154659 RepID=UPI003326DD28